MSNRAFRCLPNLMRTKCGSWQGILRTVNEFPHVQEDGAHLASNKSLLVVHDERGAHVHEEGEAQSTTTKQHGRGVVVQAKEAVHVAV
jgi:hypothetical protein